MRGRTIEFEVTDKRGKAAKTIPLYQYDYGQKLLIKGVELPEYYEVHFSNQQYGDAITVLGDSTGVLIPDSLVATGETIYVWLFLHDTSYDGETEYMGAIPVIKRAQPTDVTPTPEEQSIITEVIAALNNMEDDMSEQVQAAESAKEAAQTAQAGAESAATTASGYVDTVMAAQTAAEAAQAAAETAATSATASATSATSSANSANNALAEATNAKIAAVDAASAASTSATTATTASGNASNYATSAESAKVDAVAAQTAAEAAQTAAETAQGKAEDAQGAAETAQTAAEAAQTAAETAQTAAETAQGKAEDAEEAAEDSAEDSEAYAVGTRNGVDVEIDDPAYENNAKYYAEEAATVLEDKLDAPATAGTAGQVLTSDGEGGQAWADPSGAIDDTAGEGDTDVTWSADKLDGEFTDVLSAIQGIDDTLDKMVKTSDNVYEPSDSTFEDHVLAVNSSGKCLFYGSSDNAYRGFIFPLGGISKNLGYKFTYEGSGISSVKLCCYQYKPTSNTDTFFALNQITGTKEGNDYTGLLPVSENSAYIVFAVSFTSGANYDNIYKEIKNALFIFETTAATRNDVDWSEVEYAPRALLNINMKSIPQELLDEINDKVEKSEGYGLSKNDFSDAYKGKVDEAYEHLHPASDVIVQYGDQGITSGSWASPSNGQIYTTSSTTIYDVTDFIPCENGEMLYLCEVQSIAFYNSSKTFVGGITVSNIDGYTGNGLQNNLTISQQDVAYMRINFYNSNYSSQILNGRYAACRRNTEDYAILNMGDSVYGLNPKPYDLSSIIESVTGKKTANCGFGGTRASVHSLTEYNKFSLYNLADAIYDEDYSTQDNADFASLGSGYYYMYNLRTLKSVDFSKLSALTIAYGTNDWNASIPIDNENDPMDTDTFKGALRYSISKIQSKYPNLLVILIAPLYRTFSTEQKDSNSKTNSNGKNLPDFVEAIKEVADEYELPFIDMYNISGINTFNSTTFLRDETHLTFEDGVKRVGRITGEKVKDYV